MKAKKKILIVFCALLISVASFGTSKGIKLSYLNPDEPMMCLSGDVKICVLENGVEKCLTPKESSVKDCAGMIGL